MPAMATETATANPLITTEITASPEAPPAANVAPAPVASPASPEPIVDRGDPDIAHETALEANGVGTDGEVDVWEARYSMKNFLGRIFFWSFVSVAWIALAIYTWGYEHPGAVAITIIAGLVLGFIWLLLGRRIILARFGHYYRLTNRRVIVSTGLFDRRRDQMELLRVQDVYTSQTLWQRWIGLGTVVVQSSEQHFPLIYLAGVDEPKVVNDLVWHHARAERDRRSVKVDQI
jgi:membrane protein YdbS with pleckstrin-like domain